MSTGSPKVEDSTTISQLPPCRICYGKASGFHYGLNTCEACKAFFRRSQKKYHLYKCNKSGNCEIGYTKRGLCTYCRYQKCINLGMGKHAIKTGRYTHEKKANDIKEVKGLQKWTHRTVDSFSEIQTPQLPLSNEQEQVPVLQNQVLLCQQSQVQLDQGLQLKKEGILQLKDQEQQLLNQRQLLKNQVLQQKQQFRQVDQNQELTQKQMDQGHQQQKLEQRQRLKDAQREPRMTENMLQGHQQKLFIQHYLHLEHQKQPGPISKPPAQFLSSENFMNSSVSALLSEDDNQSDIASKVGNLAVYCSSNANPVARSSCSADPIACTSSTADPDSDVPFTDSPPQSTTQTAYDKDKISYYEEIVQRIIKVYKDVTPHTDEFYDRTWPEKEKDYLEKAELRSKVFGTLRNMSLKEYFVFYQETGIDVDGRCDFVRNIYIPYIEDCIRRCINFAKAIPGFSRICLADQIALIKTSRHSCWIISSHKSFNIQHKLYMTFEGEIISWNDMVRINDPEYIDCIFLLQSKVKQLRLTLEETCILAAFVVMFPDDNDLTDIPQIEDSQELLLHCLLYLFDKHHPDDKMRLSKFVDCLILMQTLRDLQMKDEDRVAKEWSGVVDMPPLFYEVWSS